MLFSVVENDNDYEDGKDCSDKTTGISVRTPVQIYVLVVWLSTAPMFRL